LILEGREELPEQIPGRAMELDAREAGRARARGGVAKSADDREDVLFARGARD
jgi:hypothetical protein